jgi:DNA-binding MarR family transcriptional regulator
VARYTEPSKNALFSCACFNTRTAARGVTSYYDRKLKGTGVKITQYAILAVVRTAGSITMQMLASVLTLDPSTLTRTLQPLESAGWLRIEEGDDRRKREAVLTAAGHHKVAECHALWLEAQDELKEKLGEDRFERLVGDLSALTAAIRA